MGGAMAATTGAVRDREGQMCSSQHSVGRGWPAEGAILPRKMLGPQAQCRCLASDGLLQLRFLFGRALGSTQSGSVAVCCLQADRRAFPGVGSASAFLVDLPTFNPAPSQGWSTLGAARGWKARVTLCACPRRSRSSVAPQVDPADVALVRSANRNAHPRYSLRPPRRRSQRPGTSAGSLGFAGHNAASANEHHVVVARPLSKTFAAPSLRKTV